MHATPAPYLIVCVAGRLCALPAAQVVEVLRLPDSLPAGPQPTALLGILPWRGQQVAALELAVLLGLPPSSTGDRARRLVATKLPGQAASQTVALAVDEVVGVEPLAPGSLTAIALPAGAEHTLGGFDAGFAQLIDASGTLAEQVAHALPPPEESV